MKRLLLTAAALLCCAGVARADELTLDGALRTAMAQNPSLQATLKDVGLSQADVAQAALAPNPELGATVRFPNQAGFDTNTDFSLTFNFLELSLRPLRQRLAGTQLEQARRRVAQAVVDLQATVRKDWYALAAAQQALTLQQTVVQAAQAALDLAQAQYKAGNISDLEWSRQQAAASQEQVDLGGFEQSVETARERLSADLGAPSDTALSAAAMPELPPQDPSEGEVEAAAVTSRGDLAAVRLQPQVAETQLSLARRAGGWGQIRAGVDGGQEVEGVTVIGPTLQWTLPLFNQNQGEVQKLELERQKGLLQASAAERQVRLEVRTAWQQMAAARRRVELYRKEVIPQRERVVAQGMLHYNNMLLSVYQLLADRQALSQAQQAALQASLDYWTARAELDRAEGVP